jgi:hypothetical protein
MMRRAALVASVLLYAPSLLAQTTDPSATPQPAAPAVAPGTETKAPAEAPATADVAAQTEAGTTPPDTSVAAAEEVPLSQAELDALGFTTNEGGEVSTLDTDLHISGFLDFNVSRLIAKKDSLNRGFLPPHTNFFIGNFNLYLTKNLSETFRMMGEVRFSYLPNGNIPLNNGSPNTPTTSSDDYADVDRPLKWGSIEIERVYLEWGPSRFLTVRAGSFLTPYGIWNVDHGSPTFIPVQRPYVIGNGLFPERQTGFELFGRWDATANGTLGYHLTLSNGSGPISEYRDLDNNKAVGGRLFWEQHGIGDLKIGTSAYYGEDTDATAGLAPDGMGGLKPVDTVHRQYDILALAADIVWKYKGLILQAEYISQQRRYTDKGRQAVLNEITQQTVFPIDATNWGAYGLVGYKLPWFGIMPYLIVSKIRLIDQGGTDANTLGFNAGLNIRVIDPVVVKIEYLQAWLKEKLLGSDDPFKIFQAQVAWAF